MLRQVLESNGKLMHTPVSLYWYIQIKKGYKCMYMYIINKCIQWKCSTSETERKRNVCHYMYFVPLDAPVYLIHTI